MKESTTGSDIGKQRFIGVLGGFIANNLCAFSIMYYPINNTSCETGTFFVYFITIVCLGISGCFLFKKTTGVDKDKDDKKTPTSTTDELLVILKNYDNLFFLACLMAGGMMHAFLFNFDYLYLKDLKAIPLIYGMDGFFLATTGGSVYYFSEQIISRVGGNMNAMCLSCFVWCFRYICISLMKNPYVFLAIEVSHGLSYSLFTIASLRHVGDISDPGTLATMCGVRNALYFQLSTVLANFVGGQLYNRFGGAVLFRMTSFACAAWGGVMICYILIRGNNGYTRLSRIQH